MSTRLPKNNNQITERGLKKEDRNELQQLLIHLADEKIYERGSDRILDREKEKITLLSGKIISRKEIDDFIQSKARKLNFSMFPTNPYYTEMCRIFGWPESEAYIYQKRPEAAVFTNEVIYGRFDKGVLLSLHVLNPYIGYIMRQYKHYQFLTDEGLRKLAEVINQACEMMGVCGTYYEFRKRWFEEYGVPYQERLF